MLLISALFNLIINSVTFRREKFFNRITMIVFLHSIILSFTSLLLKSLDTEIRIYRGLFHVTSITQSFVVFISLLTILILQLSSFYPRRVYNVLIFHLIKNSAGINRDNHDLVGERTRRVYISKFISKNIVQIKYKKMKFISKNIVQIKYKKMKYGYNLTYTRTFIPKNCGARVNFGLHLVSVSSLLGVTLNVTKLNIGNEITCKKYFSTSRVMKMDDFPDQMPEPENNNQEPKDKDNFSRQEIALLMTLEDLQDLNDPIVVSVIRDINNICLNKDIQVPADCFVLLTIDGDETNSIYLSEIIPQVQKNIHLELLELIADWRQEQNLLQHHSKAKPLDPQAIDMSISAIKMKEENIRYFTKCLIIINSNKDNPESIEMGSILNTMNTRFNSKNHDYIRNILINIFGGLVLTFVVYSLAAHDSSSDSSISLIILGLISQRSKFDFYNLLLQCPNINRNLSQYLYMDSSYVKILSFKTLLDFAFFFIIFFLFFILVLLL